MSRDASSSKGRILCGATPQTRLSLIRSSIRPGGRLPLGEEDCFSSARILPGAVRTTWPRSHLSDSPDPSIGGCRSHWRGVLHDGLCMQRLHSRSTNTQPGLAALTRLTRINGNRRRRVIGAVGLPRPTNGVVQQGGQESNLQPPVLETGALPIELPPLVSSILSAPRPGSVDLFRASQTASLSGSTVHDPRGGLHRARDLGRAGTAMGHPGGHSRYWRVVCGVGLQDVEVTHG